MRITNNMMIDRLLSDLRSSQSRLFGYQQMLSSGKAFSAPSDEPVKVVESLRLRSALDKTAQYLKNAGDAQQWVEAADNSLAVASNVMVRARELTVKGINSSLSQQDREALASEITEILDHLIHVANSAIGDRYIFGGQRTTTPPFERVEGQVVYKGDAGTLVRELGASITIQVNSPGGDMFANAFETLSSIAADLRQGNLDDLSNHRLKELDDAHEGMLRARAEMGARANRIELSQERLKDMEYSFTRLLSDVEDVDYSRVIVMLAAEENAYRLALNAGSRIVQPSLLDFLR